MKGELTERQAEILSFLIAFTREFGYPPTVREICRATGLRSPRSVTQHLQALERKAYIERGREKSRAIRFLHAASRRAAGVGMGEFGGVAVPMSVPGNARAAISESGAVGDFVWMDRRFVEGSNAFIARVGGTGLREAGVLAGDYVVIDPDSSPVEGALIATREGREMLITRRGGSRTPLGQVVAVIRRVEHRP